MTWFGIILLVLYAFSFTASVLKASAGGYVFEYTPKFLAVVAVFQLFIILGILLVGTGAVA